MKLTKHAQEMLSHRRISKNLLKKCINNPDFVIPTKYKKNAYLKDLGENFLKAIVAEEGKEKVVITVYWLDKRRLKRFTSLKKEASKVKSKST